MKPLFFSFFLFFGISADYTTVRQTYLKAVNSEADALQLEKLTQPQAASDAVMQAYYGSALALKAKYSYNPYNKVVHVRSGSAQLNAAVTKFSQHTEIRFLRYSVEYNTPSMVGISTHLAEDKAFILSHPPLRAHALFQSIKGFMLQTSGLTEAEKKQINAW
ncbi:MAG: hypothetical protein KJS92_02690 [Bacteroidetes bacterium]|nr:hypothetical protein [Bacteroidota bacterium]